MGLFDSGNDDTEAEEKETSVEAVDAEYRRMSSIEMRDFVMPAPWMRQV